MFRKPALAVVAVVAMLALSDLQLEFLSVAATVCEVHLSLGLSVGLELFGFGGDLKRLLCSPLAALFGASFVMSTFFLMTNAAVWWTLPGIRQFGRFGECFTSRRFPSTV